MRSRQDPVHQLGARGDSVGGHVNYAASKGGVMLMMKSWRRKCALSHSRQQHLSRRDPHAHQHGGLGNRGSVSRAVELIPYKRIGEADEIGRASVWLASDYADYVHGISLFVDGGMTTVSRFRDGGMMPAAKAPSGPIVALRRHWPEYLIEGGRWGCS